MAASVRSGYLNRVSARVKPSGALATVERPRTVVLIGLVWTWGSMVNTLLMASLFFIFDEPAIGWVNVVLACIYGACWFVFATSGDLRVTFGIAVLASLIAVPWMHVTLGGFAYSGFVLFWGVGVTFVAAFFLRRGEAISMGSIWLALAVSFGFLESSMRSSNRAPDPGLGAAMAAYTMAAMLVLLVPVVGYLLARLSDERRRAESLLLNVLPKPIADRLKRGEVVIADYYEECTVLFADIVGFTAYSRTVSPHQLVDRLNSIFSEFDNLADRHRVERVKTIGDGYMAVSGVPDARSDHLDVICRMAIDMQRMVSTGTELAVRIGINTGPVVAGVIGSQRFSFDLWGDTVNLASRLESHGQPGRIHVSEAVRDISDSEFKLVPAGTPDLKGYGPTRTYFLESSIN